MCKTTANIKMGSLANKMESSRSGYWTVYGPDMRDLCDGVCLLCKKHLKRIIWQVRTGPSLHVYMVAGFMNAAHIKAHSICVHMLTVSLLQM